MTTQEVKNKMDTLMSPCPCGSSKMFYMCCGADQIKLVENEMCPCGSGKPVKDCCMKSPDTHKM